MKNKKLVTILAIIMTVAVIIGVSAYAASNYGTTSDPLITLSYIDDVLTADLFESFQKKLDDAVAKLETTLTSAISGIDSGDVEGYKVVTLSSGQKITGSVGCEIMLRIGTATCKASSSPGLIDMTTGGTIDNGSSLTKNHLYLVTIDGSGITATADTVKVLVRGSYTIS